MKVTLGNKTYKVTPANKTLGKKIPKLLKKGKLFIGILLKKGPRFLFWDKEIQHRGETIKQSIVVGQVI